MSRNGTPYHRLLNSPRWKALRAFKLDCNPFCEDCARQGMIVPAEEVHHIRPVEYERNPDRMAQRAFDPGNLAALCRECHRDRHRQMRSHSPRENAERAKRDAEEFWKKFG